MRKVKVTLNYNNWEEKFIKVPESWTKAQVNAAVLKKYGKLDVKEWCYEEPKTVEA